MKLYIRFSSLDKFKRLHEREELLQSVLTNETGIRWSFDESYKESIEKLLEGIKYEMV